MSKKGYAAKLYVGTAGSLATNELDIVRDVTVNQEAGEGDNSTRAGEGQGSTAQTLKRTTVEFEMVKRDGNAAYDIVRDAYDSGDPIALAPRDSADGPGLDGDFVITNFSESQALDGVILNNVTAKLSTVLRPLARI